MIRKFPTLAFAMIGFLLAPVPESLAEDVNGAQVRVPLSAETWVATTTAEVEVIAHLTLVDQAPDDARNRLMSQIASLVPDARWRITAFERTSDSAGAQRWTIRATARVDQGHLDDLVEAVQAASRPGRSLRLGRVDTTPSLKEREVALKALRAVIYQSALEECAVAKALWPGHEVGVLRVDFQRPGIQPLPRPARNTHAQVAQADAPDGLSSERRIVLTAWVTLAPVQK